MSAGHLSEDEIQQFALYAAGGEPGIVDHIGSCDLCKTRLANYRLLFAAIQEQPRRAFEFDVAGLVLSQFQENPKKSTRTGWPVYLLVSAVFSLILVPLYWLRKDIATMFSGMLPITISLVTLSSILAFLFLGIELFKKYKWRTDALNY